MSPGFGPGLPGCRGNPAWLPAINGRPRSDTPARNNIQGVAAHELPLQKDFAFEAPPNHYPQAAAVKETDTYRMPSTAHS